MAKEYTMVKDNARIKADAKFAAELRLRGYKDEEDAETAPGAAATQPNPYTKEEFEAIKIQNEILQKENDAFRAAEVEKLESKKAENPSVPPAKTDDKTDDAPKKDSGKK